MPAPHSLPRGKTRWPVPSPAGTVGAYAAPCHPLLSPRFPATLRHPNADVPPPQDWDALFAPLAADAPAVAAP